MSFDKALELIHPILPSLDEVEETLNFTTASSKLTAFYFVFNKIYFFFIGLFIATYNFNL